MKAVADKLGMDPRGAEEGAQRRRDDVEPRGEVGYLPGRPRRDASRPRCRLRAPTAWPIDTDQHGHGHRQRRPRPARQEKPQVDVAQGIQALSSALGISGSGPARPAHQRHGHRRPAGEEPRRVGTARPEPEPRRAGRRLQLTATGSGEGLEPRGGRRGPRPATAMTRRSAVCGARRTTRGPSRPPMNRPIARGSAADQAIEANTMKPTAATALATPRTTFFMALPRGRVSPVPSRNIASMSTPGGGAEVAAVDADREGAQREPAAGRGGTGWSAVPSAASSRGGRCTRIAAEAPAIRNGTTRSKAAGRREQQERRRRSSRRARRRRPAARSRRPWPRSSGPGGAHRADAVEHERDGVGDVRGHRREADGQQRRVADQRGQPGDAAGQPGADPGERRGSRTRGRSPAQQHRDRDEPEDDDRRPQDRRRQPPAEPGADVAADDRPDGDQRRTPASRPGRSATTT